MKTATAKPLSVVIIIISCIVLFFSRDEMVDAISAFLFLVSTFVLMTAAVIDIAEGR
jgi:purine-cytosine permease-like protein